MEIGGTYEMNLQDTDVLADIDIDAAIDQQPEISHDLIENENLASDFKLKLKRRKMAQKREFDRGTRNYEAIANDFYFDNVDQEVLGKYDDLDQKITRGVTQLDQVPKLHVQDNEDAVINFGQTKKFQKDFRAGKNRQKKTHQLKEFVIDRTDIEHEEFEASTRASIKFKKAFSKRKVNKQQRNYENEAEFEPLSNIVDEERPDETAIFLKSKRQKVATDFLDVFDH